MRCVAVLIAVLGCQGSQPAPSEVTKSGSSIAEPEACTPVAVEGDALEVNKLEKRSLEDGRAARFHVRLDAGQVAVGAIQQRGIDVVVTTFDPCGTLLAQADSPNGAQGPEPFLIEAAGAGEYGIEVKPFVVPAPTGAGSNAGSVPAHGEYTAHLDAILSADEYAEREAATQIDSPRILALWKALHRKEPNAARAFWDSVKGKTPLVEPYPGDEKSALVTFVFRSKAPYAGMFGGPSFREKPMIRILDSDIWFLSARMPRDTRAEYSFLASDRPPAHHVPWQKGDVLDSGGRWNRRVSDENNLGANSDGSRFELQPAVEPWIAEHPENPHGTIESMTIDSQHMHEPRRIGVVLPPGYDKRASYPLIIAFDGEEYGMGPSVLLPLPRIVENLVAAKKIPPVVVALVANQGTRDRDLTMDPAFAKFVATELVPQMRAKYRAGLTATSTVVTGSSFGGLCAIYVGLNYSDVIGNVLSQSAALWFRPGDLDREIPNSEDSTRLFEQAVTSPKRPLRFYLDVGQFETDVRNDILGMNRRMYDVLRAKGYPVRYLEFSGGHDYTWWRATIADALIDLLH